MLVLIKTSIGYHLQIAACKHDRGIQIGKVNRLDLRNMENQSFSRIIVQSYIRGYHLYEDETDWNLLAGEEGECYE